MSKTYYSGPVPSIGPKAAASAQSVGKNKTAVITVVRDPQHPLGKAFSLNPDSTVTKTASVSVSLGKAIMYRVETHDELAALLTKVGEDSHAAIINASFDGIAVGEEFVILSELEIEKRLGIPRSNREKQKGIHELTFDGKTYRAVGRFKENVRPSCWQYLDRDTDKHTPAKFATLSFDEWLTEIGEMLPGFTGISYCRTASTSSRILRDGVAVGGGNGHTWIKVDDPTDIERFRTAIMVRAAQAEKTWLKPRQSRKEPGKVVGQSLTTIIDPSVFSPGRLTFVGKPVVSDGLTVESLSASVHIGDQDQLDTTMTVLPDAQKIREITGKAGVAMDVRSTNSGLNIIANDLTWDTELETKNLGIITVGACKARGIKSKIRCQTPFRDSSSFAAFLAFDSRGNPFVFDAGTSTTHRLADAKFEEFEPCDYEVIDGETHATPNPLEKYSLRGQSDEIEKRAGKEVPILGNLAIKGQATALYAAPNTGKTLITLSLLIEAIKEKRLDPGMLFYVNVDDTAKGLADKARIADEYQFHMLADGYQDFKSGDLLGLVNELVASDQADGITLILDTLTKFVDLMSTTESRNFTKVMRRFVLKGGTLIALGHTNKKPGTDGKPVYRGTSDIINDFDCVYTLGQIDEAESGRKLVEFINQKKRGNVEPHAAYSYSVGRCNSYFELLLSVQPVDQVQVIAAKQAEEISSDAGVIAVVKACIQEGINTKMLLSDAVAKRAVVSRKLALRIIEKYTGCDPEVHCWMFSVQDRGAKVFCLLDQAPAVQEPSSPND